MNCEETRKSLKEFFEDLVTEGRRSEIREHLAGCKPCMDSALRFGSFASELTALTVREVPFDLTAELLWELGKTPGSKKEKGDSPRFHPFGIRAAAAAVFLAVLGALILWSRPHPPGPSGKKHLEAPALRKSGEAERRNSPLRSSRRKPAIAVSLRPFHWHLQFKDAAGRETFLKQAHGLVSKPEFESPDFLVLSMDRKMLGRLLAAAGSSQARVQGSSVSLAHLPAFEGPVRVSMLLESADKAGAVFPPHLHFKFTLANRFVLRDRLLEKGFRMKYETEELWVLELLPSQLKDLRQEALQSTGLATDYSKMTATGTEGGKPVTVSIYIEEG